MSYANYLRKRMISQKKRLEFVCAIKGVLQGWTLTHSSFFAAHICAGLEGYREIDI